MRFSNKMVDKLVSSIDFYLSDLSSLHYNWSVDKSKTEIWTEGSSLHDQTIVNLDKIPEHQKHLRNARLALCPQYAHRKTG